MLLTLVKLGNILHSLTFPHIQWGRWAKFSVGCYCWLNSSQSLMKCADNNIKKNAIIKDGIFRERCADRQQRFKGGFQSCADMLSPQGGAREPGRPDLNIVHSPQERLRRRAHRSQVTSALFELSPENLTDRGEYLGKSMRICEIDQLLLGKWLL